MMELNNKLISMYLLFEISGVIIAGILILLHCINIIQDGCYLINSIILVVIAILCISYHIYIFKRCYNISINSFKVFIIIFFIASIIYTILIFAFSGLHISIIFLWEFASLHINAYNITYILERKDCEIEGKIIDNQVQHRKYNEIIAAIKRISNVGLFLSYFAAVANVIHPFSFSSVL